MARPRAGDWLDDEISGWRAQRIDIIISLLEQEEVSDEAIHPFFPCSSMDCFAALAMTEMAVTASNQRVVEVIPIRV
jgi:hypothetical protein